MILYLSTTRRSHLAKYRSREDILSIILKVVSEGGATRADIMYKASMNFRLMKKYVSLLLNNGVLITDGTTYRITDKGMYFLQIYDQLNATVRNIQGHGSQLLHVVFSDSHFATTHLDAPMRYAYVSTIDRLAFEKKEPRNRGG